MKEKKWSTPIVSTEITSKELVALENTNSIFLESEGLMFRYSLLKNQLELVFPISRIGAQTRLLPSGQLVRYGGLVNENMISTIDLECEDSQKKKCPEIFVGYGSLVPFTTVDTGTFNKEKNIWETIVSNKIQFKDAISSVVTQDGKIVVLELESSNKQGLNIRQSSIANLSWDKLPLPSGITYNENLKFRLLSTTDPRDSTKDILFLLEGWIDANGNDIQIDQVPVKIWSWSDTGKKWSLTMETDGKTARSVPKPLGPELSSTKGKKMIGVGWHTKEPTLWLEQ
mgnify:CR=1 FL=1